MVGFLDKNPSLGIILELAGAVVFLRSRGWGGKSLARVKQTRKHSWSLGSTLDLDHSQAKGPSPRPLFGTPLYSGVLVGLQSLGNSREQI